MASPKVPVTFVALLGIPVGKRRTWNRLHKKAWALCSEGNQLPHAKRRVRGRDPDGTYYTGTPELRARYAALRAECEQHGFQPPLKNGYDWFFGGGVWF